MGNVYANGKEVSSKKTTNKSAPAMMSVCLSPPSPPAGPVPIPYPVTDMASNTTDGTGSVFIKKKEVGKKNGSNYKKCKGNEPATRNFGMDVVSHTIQGKTKFEAYSFDVMFEKDGAERFMDITTTNHMNPASAVTSNLANAATISAASGCEELKEQNKNFRDDTGQDTGTITSAKFEPHGRKPRFYRGFSSMSKLSTKAKKAWVATNGFAEGVFSSGKRVSIKENGKRKKKIASNMNKYPDCGKRYYGANAQNGSTHAEAKIIEDILANFSPRGGSILLAIDWPNNPPVPCSKCEKTIAAACKCFSSIKRCTPANTEKELCT